MMLADTAQEVGGKLYILGGGWSVTGPEVGPMALAIKIDVPWNSANQRHKFDVMLLGEDGQPPEMLGPEGQVPGEVRFSGDFEVGRPPRDAGGNRHRRDVRHPTWATPVGAGTTLRVAPRDRRDF